MRAVRTIVGAVAAILAGLSVGCDRSEVTPNEPSAPPSVANPQVVANFDLATIDGQALPLTYSGHGVTGTISAGHFVFYDNGTCSLDFTGIAVTPCGYTLTGQLARSASLVFYDDSGRGSFATGVIAAGVLTVTWNLADTDVYQRSQ